MPLTSEMRTTGPTNLWLSLTPTNSLPRPDYLCVDVVFNFACHFVTRLWGTAEYGCTLCCHNKHSHNFSTSGVHPAVNCNLLPDPISIHKIGRCLQIRLIYFSSSFHYEHAHNLLMVLLFFDVAFIKKKETSPSYNLLFDIFLGCCSSGLRLMNDLEWRRECV